MNKQSEWRVGIAMTAIVLAGCGADLNQPAPGPAEPAVESTASTSQAGSGLPRIDLPVERSRTVEGLLSVNGHDIYARCSGVGSPTAVYFTGWAPDRSRRAVEAVRLIESVVAGKRRICSYERRNTGRSEIVEGTQTPEDIVADVEGVLDAMGENGPFLLLGASFGGLVASAYAVAHPERVAGIVMLDASIPDDYIIDERHGFKGMCLAANREADARASLEKIDNCQLAKWAYDRRAQEPDVPLVYLAAKDGSERGASDDPLRKAFVQRWSPGVWETVNAPHWMDEAAPELVVKNLNRVTTLTE